MRATIARSALVLAVTAASLFGQHHYTATPIQAPGFALSSLVWLSDDGKLGVGSGLNANASGNALMECLRYEQGVFTVLAQPGLHCSASSANSGGDLVGILFATGGLEMDAFLYRAGEFFPFTSLLPGKPDMSVAAGINANGDVVGYFYANPKTASYIGLKSPSSLVEYRNQYAFRYSGGELVQLPTLGGANTQALAVDDKGDAVGSSDLTVIDDTPSQTHAVLFPKSGGIVDLGTLGGYLSSAVAINSRGQVVGMSTTVADVNFHAFIHDGRTIAEIRLPGTDSRAVSINNDGEVVGVYRHADYVDHPFYYAGGKTSDLNNLLENAPRGITLSTPQFITNSGQILVMGFMPLNSNSSARMPMQFLLTPAGDGLNAVR